MSAKKNIKSTTYLREIEIHYRKRQVPDKAALAKPLLETQQVINLFADLQNETKEKMLTLFLDSKNRILCFEIVGIGTLHAIYVRPMEVFRTAFLVNAYVAIVIHNHPSGDPTPSSADKELTKVLTRMASDMGLVFLDHIIIAEDGYYSFCEDGKLSNV